MCQTLRTEWAIRVQQGGDSALHQLYLPGSELRGGLDHQERQTPRARAHSRAGEAISPRGLPCLSGHKAGSGCHLPPQELAPPLELPQPALTGLTVATILLTAAADSSSPLGCSTSVMPRYLRLKSIPSSSVSRVSVQFSGSSGQRRTGPQTLMGKAASAAPIS